MFIVYLITNIFNSKKYVGQTKNTVVWRWARHKTSASRNSTYPIHRAIRKYGIESFSVEQIDTAETREIASLKEEYWILFYEANIFGKGYNCSTGGEGLNNPSEETRRKMGDASRGKPGFWTGKKMSDETKAKMSASHKGRVTRKNYTVTAETRKKMSDARKGKPGTYGFLGKKHTPEIMIARSLRIRAKKAQLVETSVSIEDRLDQTDAPLDSCPSQLS
jgi:hypothetical protein